MKKFKPLIVGALGLVLLPFAMAALNLSLSTATQVVALSIAALGLNLLVGYTGLTSFGHSAWFGIGAYAAALAQKHWLGGQIVLPLLLSMAFVALLATAWACSCCAGAACTSRCSRSPSPRSPIPLRFAGPKSPAARTDWAA